MDKKEENGNGDTPSAQVTPQHGEKVGILLRVGGLILADFWNITSTVWVVLINIDMYLA